LVFSIVSKPEFCKERANPPLCVVFVLIQSVEVLDKFGSAITRNTADQHEEIKTARTQCLESFAALQNVDAWRQRVHNPAYRGALRSRPLDMTDQRKMKVMSHDLFNLVEILMEKRKRAVI